MVRWKEPIIPDSILDQLLNGSDAKTVFETNGLLDQPKKALAERALNAEMNRHLSADEQVGNVRNGYGKKTVLTDSGREILGLRIETNEGAKFWLEGMNEIKNRGIS